MTPGQGAELLYRLALINATLDQLARWLTFGVFAFCVAFYIAQNRGRNRDRSARNRTDRTDNGTAEQA